MSRWAQRVLPRNTTTPDDGVLTTTSSSRARSVVPPRQPQRLLRRSMLRRPDRARPKSPARLGARRDGHLSPPRRPLGALVSARRPSSSSPISMECRPHSVHDPTVCSSAATSRRRARADRDLTVPIGTSSCSAIWSGSSPRDVPAGRHLVRRVEGRRSRGGPRTAPRCARTTSVRRRRRPREHDRRWSVGAHVAKRRPATGERSRTTTTRACGRCRRSLPHATPW